MSVQSMHEFLGAAAADPVVARGLGMAIGGKSGPEAVDAVAAYAAGRGYDVTTADAEAVRAQFAAAIQSEGSLSDTDLGGVAGGAGAPLDELRPDRVIGTIANAMINDITGIARDVGDLFSKW